MSLQSGLDARGAPDKAWEHHDCGGAGEPCKIQTAKKDPDTIFASLHGYSHNG